MNYKFLYLLICILGLHSLTAQQHQVIDRKGTQITVTSSQVSTTSTAPSNPNEGDVWIDTASNTLKIWEEGTVPAWKEIASIRNWISSSQNGSYLANHLVSYEGALYKNLTGDNLDTTPDNDTINWKEISVDIVPKWKSQTNGGSYATNDVINYNGMLYKNLTSDNLDTTPDLDTTNWAVLLNTSISDADGDTKIEVEQTADEDIIRFTTAGTERLRLNGSRIEPLNNSFSVFIGENAGTDTVSSSNNNVFIGRNAGSGIDTGHGNVGIGTNALKNTDEGINNTSIGISSLQSNQNGTGLVAVGVRALKSNISGIQNTALGKDALGGNTTGAYNIGIGPDAGRYIADGSTPRETGANSIYIGKDTKARVDGTRNEIVIGTDVTGKGDNTITLGNGASSELYTAADIISKRFNTIWKPNNLGGNYDVNHVVLHNGVFYKNLTGNNTAVAPDADTTNWFPNRGNVSTFTLLNNQLISVNQTFEVESTELLGSGVDWAPNGDFTLTPGTYELIAEVLIDFHESRSGVLHFTFTNGTNARFPASYEGTAVMNNSNRAYGSVPARAFITITADTTVRLRCTATASGAPNRGRIKSDNGQSRVIIKKIN